MDCDIRVQHKRLERSCSPRQVGGDSGLNWRSLTSLLGPYAIVFLCMCWNIVGVHNEITSREKKKKLKHTHRPNERYDAYVSVDDEAVQCARQDSQNVFFPTKFCYITTFPPQKTLTFNKDEHVNSFTSLVKIRCTIFPSLSGGLRFVFLGRLSRAC